MGEYYSCAGILRIPIGNNIEKRNTYNTDIMRGKNEKNNRNGRDKEFV
jgi:hypothetical protein